MSDANWSDPRQALAFQLTRAFPDRFRMWVGMDHDPYLEARFDDPAPNSFGYRWVWYATHGQPVRLGQFEVLVAPLIYAAQERGWVLIINAAPTGVSVSLAGPGLETRTESGGPLGVLLARLLLRAHEAEGET